MRVSHARLRAHPKTLDEPRNPIRGVVVHLSSRPTGAVVVLRTRLRKLMDLVPPGPYGIDREAFRRRGDDGFGGGVFSGTGQSWARAVAGEGVGHRSIRPR